MVIVSSYKTITCDSGSYEIIISGVCSCKSSLSVNNCILFER